MIRRDGPWSRGWSAWTVHALAIKASGSVIPDTLDSQSSTEGESPVFVGVRRGSTDLRAERSICTLDARDVAGIIIGASVALAIRRESGV